MRTIEVCKESCPMLGGIEDSDRQIVLENHLGRGCIEQRLGQIGLLCGVPTGEEKNQMTREVLAASRHNNRSYGIITSI